MKHLGASMGAALLVAALAAQPAANTLEGFWTATIEHAGEQTRVVMHIEQVGGALQVRWSTPILDLWEAPVGTAKVDGDSVRIGPFALAWDNAAGTLSGTLPAALVPVHSIPAVFHRTDSPGRQPRRPLDAPQSSPVWTFDAGAPVWADAAYCAGAVLVGDDGGRLHAIDGTTGKERWTLSTGRPIRARAICDGGDAFVQSDDGNLFRVELKSGAERWHVPVAAPFKRLPLFDPKSRYQFRASAVVVDGSRLYLGTADGKLLALDAASGRTLWKFAAADAITASPALSNGRVFFGSFDGYLYAVDARGGTLVWKRDMGAPVTSTPAAAGGNIVAGSRSYDLTAFRASDGATAWNQYYWFSWVESSPTPFERFVYVGSSDAARAYAFDAATGRREWSTDVGGDAWGQPVVTADRVVVSVAGGVNYPMPHRGGVVALDRRTGRPLWQFSVDRPHVSGSEYVPYGFAGSPASGGGLVYAGALDGRVYAFRP